MFWEDDKILTPIEQFFDDKSYLETREIVYNAVTGELKNSHPTIGFTPKEIIIWAKKECENTYIISGACSALDGADNLAYLVGKPEINPITEQPNSIEEQKGLFGDIADKTSDVYMATENRVIATAQKAFLGVAILGVGYLFLKPHFEQMAKGK